MSKETEMATLADIRKASETQVRTFVDDTTPAGHFVAVAKVLGLYTDYLLAGAEGDPDAVVVGRIEFGGSIAVYKGRGIKGGRLIVGAADSVAAFQQMTDPPGPPSA